MVWVLFLMSVFSYLLLECRVLAFWHERVQTHNYLPSPYTISDKALLFLFFYSVGFFLGSGIFLLSLYLSSAESCWLKLIKMLMFKGREFWSSCKILQHWVDLKNLLSRVCVGCWEKKWMKKIDLDDIYFW